MTFKRPYSAGLAAPQWPVRGDAAYAEQLSQRRQRLDADIDGAGAVDDDPGPALFYGGWSAPRTCSRC